jgi:hypothetical protein
MSKPANIFNPVSISKPTEYEAMMIVKDLKETIIGMQQNPYQVRCLGTKNTRRARQSLLWHPVSR